mmetsp:Transcript_7669/g.18950  ORF Transcript_7669/g.18950 Transcript_7669/m.18950 type:complete len:227 (-) Transcript_7669:194-874(-)
MRSMFFTICMFGSGVYLAFAILEDFCKRPCKKAVSDTLQYHHSARNSHLNKLADNALQIRQAAKQLANREIQFLALDDLRHELLPRINRINIRRRLQQRLPQKPPPRQRLRLIQHPQQALLLPRLFPRELIRGPQQLQSLDRAHVEEERPLERGVANAQAVGVEEDAAGLLEVLEEGRAGGEREVFGVFGGEREVGGFGDVELLAVGDARGFVEESSADVGALGWR